MPFKGGLGILAILACLTSSTAIVSANTVSQSFTATGEHEFVVPSGVISMQVELIGGYGGSGNSPNPGGTPATATATLAVSPGEALYAEVGGNGESATPSGNVEGGYNGGGNGSFRIFLFASEATGGGGGGASDVQRCPTKATVAECGGQSPLASRLLVAGGGGGGGGNGLDPPSTAGGDGGSADHAGANGSHDSVSDVGGTGGSHGTSSAGGMAGTSGQCEPSTGSGCATDGVLGQGGNGAEPDGGGGGGGIFGGGGGGGGAFSLVNGDKELANGGGGGGGGGSSGVPSAAIGVSDFLLLSTAEGAMPLVKFTWVAPAPTVVTGAIGAITSTTATLNGTVDPNTYQVSDCHFAILPVPPSGATIPCQQQVGSGPIPVAVSANLSGLDPSTTYTVTLTATSAQGSSSGSAVTFTTPAASGPGTGPGAAQPPTIANLALSPARFRRGKHAATIAKTKSKVPTATTISFDLSTSATVTLSFEQSATGIRSGHKCLARSAHKAHGRRAGHTCTLYETVHGGVTFAGHQGLDKVHFEGILTGGAHLPAKRYRLTASATNAAGKSTATQHPTFTLLS